MRVKNGSHAALQRPVKVKTAAVASASLARSLPDIVNDRGDDPPTRRSVEGLAALVLSQRAIVSVTVKVAEPHFGSARLSYLVFPAGAVVINPAEVVKAKPRDEFLKWVLSPRLAKPDTTMPDLSRRSAIINASVLAQPE